MLQICICHVSCSEIRFVKSLGDQHGLEEPCVKQKKNCGKQAVIVVHI